MNETERKAYLEQFNRRTHVLGRIVSAITLVLLVGAPFLIGTFLGAMPDMGAVAKGFLSVGLVWTVSSVAEFLIYTPMLGAGGGYLAFITGNLINMKIPCAVNARDIVGTKTGTAENEIISTLSIATSSLVTIVVLALGVALLVPLQPVLQSPVLQPAFANVVPALFGAMAYKYYRKNMKIALWPLVLMSVLFILVPGLLITNSMRDIIYGDTSSGVSRIVQVLLSAFAIALGTAAAWHVTTPIYGHAEAAAALTYPLWAQGIATFFACMGFVILFNVHDWGSVLCALGSALTWIVYLLCSRAGFSIYSANFFSEVVAAVYSEGMGRWRKCPVTSYLVISSIPLLPGAGIYYTMSIGLSGSVQAALQKGLETAGIAGSLAVGILLVSTVFRAVNARRHPAAHL